MTAKAVPSILILSSKVDIATDHVILKLEERFANFYRINTEDFPLNVASSVRIENCSPESWRWNTRSIDFSNVRAVWFRRHRLPQMPDVLDGGDQEYCLREADWFVKGLIYHMASIPQRIGWMNHPARAQFAESKIYQLAMAKEVGFQLPTTLVSNDPIEVRNFFRDQKGRMIAKPLRLGYFDRGDRQTCVFTSLIKESDLQDDDQIRIAPVIYQKHIDKLFDVRVTIVGGKIFAAAIDSQKIPSAVVDWRQSETAELPHLRHDLPPSVEELCISYMNALGLSFGAIDLILTPDGNYVFLEINSSGQWVWIEDRLELPISEAISDWLLSCALQQ